MASFLFENFEQDTRASILTRYPGSVRVTDASAGGNIVGWPMYKEQSASTWFQARRSPSQSNVYHAVLNYQDDGRGINSSVSLRHSFFGIFSLRAALNRLYILDHLGGNDIVVPTPESVTRLRGWIKQIYVIMDLGAKQISVFVNGEVSLLQVSIASWPDLPTSGTALSRITVQGTEIHAISSGLPNVLTSFAIASDLPATQMLALDSIKFEPAQLVAGAHTNMSFSDQGYVQDVGKNDPLLLDPSIYSESEGSIDYTWTPDPNALSTVLYAAGRSENTNYLVLNGTVNTLTLTQAPMAPLEAVAGEASINMRPVEAMKLVLETTAANATFSPRFTGASNILIDWGDGTKTNLGTGTRADHVYPTAGTYEVQISGRCETLIAACPDLIRLEAWGELGFKGFSFYKSSGSGDPAITSDRLVSVPNYLPESVTTLFETFAYCSAFDDPSIDLWDIANVISLARTFLASGVTQRCGNWYTVNVTNLTSTFASSRFNGPIEAWITRNVDTMGPTFYNNPAFNRDLSKWCVPLITSEPTNFAVGAPLLTPNKRPVWGTCPAP